MKLNNISNIFLLLLLSGCKPYYEFTFDYAGKENLNVTIDNIDFDLSLKGDYTYSSGPSKAKDKVAIRLFLVYKNKGENRQAIRVSDLKLKSKYFEGFSNMMFYIDRGYTETDQVLIEAKSSKEMRFECIGQADLENLINISSIESGDIDLKIASLNNDIKMKFDLRLFKAIVE